METKNRTISGKAAAGISREGKPLPLIGTITGYLPMVEGRPAPELLTGERRRIYEAERTTVRGDFSGGRAFYTQVRKDGAEFLSAADVTMLKAVGSGDLELFDEIWSDVAAYPARYGTEAARQAAEIYRTWVTWYLRAEVDLPRWIENPDLNSFPPDWRHQAGFLVACRLKWKKEFTTARLFTNALLSLNESFVPVGFAGDIVLKLLLAEICRGAGRYDEELKWCREAVLAAKPHGIIVAFLGRVMGRKHALGAALEELAPDLLAQVESRQDEFFRNRVRFHNHLTGHACSETLTVRQFFIGCLLKRGYRYKEIAARMGVRPGRFNVLVADLYETLGIGKNTELEGRVW